MSPYAKVFLAIHGLPLYDWQKELADDATCVNRLIRTPTGRRGSVALEARFDASLRKREPSAADAFLRIAANEYVEVS